ncbi:MAG: LytTR family DNA-binding domain-containing protein [Bacteroidota bacterium]
MQQWNTSSSVRQSLLLGFWLYIFLVFIGPFDIAPLNIDWRLQIMIGYGVVFAIANFLAERLNQHLIIRFHLNTYVAIISFFLLFLFIHLFPTYWYYQSNFIQGTFSFHYFVFNMYLPIFLITIPLMLIGKWLFFKWTHPSNDKIIFRGENKMDILQLRLADLIYVQSAQNYVEFHYQLQGKVRKKVMRSSLKKVAEEIPELTQVHRFYLVNLEHFVCWKDQKTIDLGHVTIPVSATYKQLISSEIAFHP